jgi:hypothetical protein
MSNRLTNGSAPNRARESWQRPGTFKPGHTKTGGRKHGTPNVVTRELKVAIVTAAFRLGSDGKGKDGIVGYLTHIAKNDIKTFVMLLRAVLPLQLKARTNENRAELDADGNPYLTADGEPRYPTYEETLEDARKRGLPVNLMKLDFVQLLRSKGASAAHAMRAARLNSRLELMPFDTSEIYDPKHAGGDVDEPHTNPLPVPSTKETGS